MEERSLAESHLSARSHWKILEEGPSLECTASAGLDPSVGSAEGGAAVASVLSCLWEEGVPANRLFTHQPHRSGDVSKAQRGCRSHPRSHSK